MAATAVRYDPKLVEEAIELAKKELPGEIEWIRYSPGYDWADEPAMYFKVLLTDAGNLFERVLRDDDNAAKQRHLLIKGISDTIFHHLKWEDYEPYFRFRSVPEMRNFHDPDVL